MQYTQQQTVQTCPSLRQHKPFGTDRPTKSRRTFCASARALEQKHLQVSQGISQLGEGNQLTQKAISSRRATHLSLQSFPTDYSTAVRQAQNATLAAIADGHKLIEVEFPTSSLQGVSGQDIQLLSQFTVFLQMHVLLPQLAQTVAVTSYTVCLRCSSTRISGRTMSLFRQGSSFLRRCYATFR
jgi:hypothetical protein